MRLGHAEENAMMVLGKQGLLKGVKSCKLDFCEHCVLGEQSWLKFVTAKTKQLTMKYVQLWLKNSIIQLMMLMSCWTSSLTKFCAKR